jgi:uncharacterized beta-barrel protein YwiB (DUF1934 family)
MENVMISIKGLFELTDDEDNIELVTDGTYTFENGRAEFQYKESELTGMEGTTTSFIVSDNSVMLTRNGAVTMQMYFQEGKKNYFVYETPFGSMNMGLDTHSIASNLGENGGEIEVKYVLDLSGSPTGNYVKKNTFNINITKQ